MSDSPTFPRPLPPLLFPFRLEELQALRDGMTRAINASEDGPEALGWRAMRRRLDSLIDESHRVHSLNGGL